MTNATATLAATLRDHDLVGASDALAALLSKAPLAWISEVVTVVDLLGADSLLVLNVAFTDATVAAGEAAGRCKVGSRTRRAHLARFEALCAAHDRVLAVEKARAL